MWSISWWGGARQRLRLAHCELLCGSRPARVQGAHLRRPQEDHFMRARGYHGIKGRSSEASGHVTRSHAAGAAHA